MRITPFGVEIWMNEWETQCALNLAETCVHSLSLGELVDLAGAGNQVQGDLMAMRMTYGAIPGSDRLRTAVAALYDRQTPDNVLITHGTIGANAMVYEALVEPGDVVISVKPTYQQHYSIPESFGATVRILPLREENGWLPDLDELRDLARGGVKLIAINNPNNPTGALMPDPMLRDIAAIAREAGAWLLCDEVYRGTEQAVDRPGPAICDLYERGISTCGMSKAFSLAGLRLGWIAAPREVLEAASIHRDYTTISVGQVDDYFATMALENADRILDRSRAITRANLAILDAWVATEPRISYIRPAAGTTALLRLHLDMPSRDFCIALLRETGVMLTPGSVMDMEGHLRIGYACETQVLREGLARLSDFLRSQP